MSVEQNELLEKIKNDEELMKKIKDELLSKEKKKRVNNSRRPNIFKGITAMPYRGSKWKFRNQIYDGLKDIKFENENLKIFDLFGGSGSLSLIFKTLYPKAQIVLNDYDVIIEKDGENIIDKSLTLTNEVLNKIRTTLTPEDFNKEKIINSDKIHTIINEYKEQLDKDIIATQAIASNINFNGRYELNAATYWNRIKKTNYEMYYHNFEGIKIIHDDFEKVLKDESEKEEKDITKLFLLDPPYLYTDTTGYNTKYWKLSKYLFMLVYIFKHPDYKFILFEGKKSCLDDIFSFFEELNTIKLNYKRVPISKNEFMILINF